MLTRLVLAMMIACMVVPCAQGLRLQGSGNEGKTGFKDLADQAVKAQRAGEGEQAIRLYLRALQVRPEWPDGWRNVGMLLADRKEFSRAEAAFKNLLEIEPKNGAGWTLLGLCQYEQGRLAEAYPNIERGRNLGIGNADLEKVAVYYSALIMLQQGEFAVARRHLNQMARAGSEDPEIITAFGVAALRIPQVPDKLTSSQKALADRVGRIEYQIARTPFPDTVAAYQKLIAEFPRTPGLHYAFGDFLATAGHAQEALEEMRRELEINPQDVMALLQLAMNHLSLGQPESALPPARKAVDLAPKLFVAHYALGWTLYKLGQTESAIPELEETVRLEPNSPQGHYALSQAYSRAGRREEANRERETFARLGNRAGPTSQAPSPAKGPGSAAERLPIPPEP